MDESFVIEPVQLTCLGSRRYELAVDGRTVAEANKFLDAIELRGLSRLTVRAYAYDLLSLYRWLHETHRKFHDLTPADLVEFIAAQRNGGAEPRSINRRLSTTRLFYRFCTNQELGSGPGVSLPAPHYRGPGRDRYLGIHRLRRRQARALRVKVPHKLVEPLSPEQVRSFLRSLDRYRDLAIVHLMLLCGLRSKEVLEMELADVVFLDARVRVRGKGERERSVPLPDLLAAILRQYLAFERPRRCSEPRLFVVLQGRRRGEPMTAAGLRSLFRHRRRRAALAIANAHRFRHTFGADMARAGVRLPVLQRLMGHADLHTTLGYIELSLADVAEQYERAMKTISERYRRR
jgi:site-specific recombinase XerD